MDLYAAVKGLMAELAATQSMVSRLTEIVVNLAESQREPDEELAVRVEKIERWIEEHAAVQYPETHNAKAKYE